MSLAMYASDYNNTEISTNNNPIQKKRENIRQNKTLKRREGFKSNPKLEAMVKKIHDDEEEDELNNYEPLQAPSSAGVERMENSMENSNQIIYLLEEQQDENTGHITEELILYSFLGVFIIFIVDSFARVGKYVR